MTAILSIPFGAGCDMAVGHCEPTRRESTSLPQIKAALKRSLMVDEVNNYTVHTLTSIRLAATSVQRFIERVLRLRERSGFLDSLGETQPRLDNRIAHMRRERDALCSSLDHILARVQELPPENSSAVDSLSQELLTLLTKLGDHDRAETELMEEAFLQDIGGEG
jgi:hypothetical protein